MHEAEGVRHAELLYQTGCAIAGVSFLAYNWQEVKCIDMQGFLLERGKSDKIAAFAKYHNPNIQSVFYLENELSSNYQNFIAELEKTRVQAAAASSIVGIKKNIRNLWVSSGHCDYIADETTKGNSNFTQIERNVLYVLHFIILKNSLSLSKDALYRNQDDTFACEQVYHSLTERCTVPLKLMCACLNNQKFFAENAFAVIKMMFEEHPNFEKNTPPESVPDKDDKQENQNTENHSDSTTEEDNSSGELGGDSLPSDIMPLFDGDKTASLGVSDIPLDDGNLMLSEIMQQRPKNVEFSPAFSYKVFTKKFDRVVDAKALISMEELTRLRSHLDRQVAPWISVVNKLASKLKRRLMAKYSYLGGFNEEHGILSPSHLSQIVVNPLAPPVFFSDVQNPLQDTVITLLIDNSGSMRGRPISIAAICADILSRTLEQCQMRVEILGFTTAEWKGGNSFKLWGELGCPHKPGRLNDLLHIVYKSADTPWRRAQKNLGAMLREGLLKENIDGEALEWAFKRLLARQEKRRILMVISDGAPVDDATMSNNSNTYLCKHLKEVVNRIHNSQNNVELFAIGIGHDVTSYYPKSIVIRDVSELAVVMVEKFLDLFSA